MSESKFLKYQDTTGTGLLDVCDEVIEVPEAICDESPCIPYGTAITPNWRRSPSSVSFLNEKICYFQVPIETPYTTTIEEKLLKETDLPEEEADGSLNRRFEEYLNDAVVAFLGDNNKDDSEANKKIVEEATIWDVKTDYYLEPRAMSRLRLLYSVPFDVIYNLEDGAQDEEDDEDESAEIEVTYTIDDLKLKLLRIRKGLKLYSWYNKLYTKIEDGNLYYQDAPYEGLLFALENYGDWGILKGSITAKLLPELDEFLNTKNYKIGGSGGGAFGRIWRREKIEEVTFSFNSDYELIKLTVYTEGCENTPIFFKKDSKLGPLLRPGSAWTDPTAMAYLAQLDDMESDLMAREPLPWLEFVKKYTYPTIYSTTNQAYANTDPQNTVVSCVAAALADEGKQLGEDILDEVFNLGDAIAYQFNKNLCSEDIQGIIDEKIKIGQVWDSDIQQNVDIMKMAKMQAYESIDSKSTLAFCAALTDSVDSIEELWEEAFDKIKFCGMTELMMSTVSCLFSGLTFEQAMATIIESALRAMSLENFDKLFVGLPPSKQAELDALIKKKLESGDVFQQGSDLQYTSDQIASDANPTPDAGYPFEDEAMVTEQQKSDMQGDPPQTTGGEPLTWGSGARRDERTLGKTLDASGATGKLDPNLVMEAVILAYLELYADAYMDLLAELNKLPGAQMVSYIIATLDCPVPPPFNPSYVDFIKDFEIPFCTTTHGITMPRYENPYGWMPSRNDFQRLLMEAAKYAIQQALLKILIMIFTKICDILGGAACKAAGATGQALAALASGGRTKIVDAIRDSICGDDVPDEVIDDTLVDMFSDLGVGTAALADTEQVLNLAGDVSNAVTTEELYSAFLCEPSAEFLQIVRQIIHYEYPEFEAGLRNDDTIKSFFCNMGNLFPGAFKEKLQDFLDSFPDAIPQAAGLCACASPEQVEEFCDLRSQILSGRATAEQITQICVPSNDLSDIANALQGGIPEAALPPLFSDPGCDNGVLPIEPAESVSVTTAGLSGDLEALKMEFAYDMIGNGPWESKYGLMNMVLSDTMGLPLTAHNRKASNRRGYVDFYIDQNDQDILEDIDSDKGIFNAIFPNPPKLSKQEGAFPTKIGEWLQDYLLGNVKTDLPPMVTPDASSREDNGLGRNLPPTVTFASNNEFIGNVSTSSSFARAGVRTVGSGVNLLRLDSDVLSYNTTFEPDFETKEIKFVEQARKSTADLVLSFQDNCKGLQADFNEDTASDSNKAYATDSADEDPTWYYDTGDAYSKGFDLELYLSDLVSDDGVITGARNRGSLASLKETITSLDDGHRHTYTIGDLNTDKNPTLNGETSWADGHTHSIANGVVEEVCDEVGQCHTHTLLEASLGKTPGTTNQPRDTARIKILEKSNLTGVTFTKLAAMVPVVRVKIFKKSIELFAPIQEALTPKNSTDTVDGPLDFLRYISKWGDGWIPPGLTTPAGALTPYFTFPTIAMQDVKYEFLSVDDTLDGINFDRYPQFLSTFSSYQSYPPQVVLLHEILKNNGNDLDISTLQTNYDTIMTNLTLLIAREVAENENAFKYGATYDDLSTNDIEYVLEEPVAGVDGTTGNAMTYEAGSNYYDVKLDVPLLDPLRLIFKLGWRPILPKDQIMGISRMQYNDNVLAAAAKDAGEPIPTPTNRVFYLDPLTYGGSYVNPPLYMSPSQSTGWLGFVEVMFPEMSPCKPYTTDLIDFKDIQQKIDDAYPFIPEDERLRDDPDCAVELPYNRILNRADVAGLEALISAAIRIYASTNFIKSIATFTKFNPSFPDVFSSLYAQYIVEDMEDSFKGAQKAFWEFFNPFKDSKFWYGFLEQTVQLYGRKVDDGSIIDPPEDVLDALGRLNNMQQGYAYPDQTELNEEKGEMAGLFESLKKYRIDKNYEAIQKTEEDAKLIFKELVKEELNFMGAKLIENLKLVGMSPSIYDLDYYILQYLSQGGSSLTLNEELVRTYVDLPTEGDEHYTSGGEFAASDGSEYIGYYHVIMDVEGNPVYMTGEFDTGEASALDDTLTPFANKVTVNVGDIADLGAAAAVGPMDVLSTEGVSAGWTPPFKIEKYMRLNDGDPQSASSALISIQAKDPSANISDYYPGTLELVTDSNGHTAGLTGELGVRYGLRFSLVLDSGSYTITEVEVDSLDLKINQVDPFDKDSLLLLCLIKMLKKDEKFKMVAHYIFPLSKLTAMTAIYNGEAFLPSIGEKVVPIGAVNSDSLAVKPGSNVGFTMYGFDDGTGEMEVTTDEAVAGVITPEVDGVDGWANKVDRTPGSLLNPLAGMGVVSYDEWDQVLLRNSKSKIKRMFKNYYKSRDLDDEEDEPADSGGIIITNQLKEKFRPRPGKELLPFWKRRMLRTNPFNANGELCEEKD